MTDDYLWDPTSAPDPDIQKLEALLRPLKHQSEPLRMETLAARPRWRPTAQTWLVAASALFVLTIGYRVATHERSRPWTVAVRQGTAVVRNATGEVSHGTLASGGIVETDARSAATVTVGRIGRAELGPDSRLRLLDANAAEHRLSLERGTMHAMIDAPPRYFLVETASALAVDLGCVYTLSVDEGGNGTLVVEEGEVELQHGPMFAAVLAGNSAAIRAGMGPGLPFPTTATASLRHAVAMYDANPRVPSAVDAVLAAADAHSTITLWHLLQRESPEVRARIYDRLAALAPPPVSVTRDRVVRGESYALQRWRTDLQPSWITEPPLLRRWRNMLRRTM